MQYAVVKGSVVATQKVTELKAQSLKLLLPCDRTGSPIGDAFVAVDAVGARPGDLVLWVGKREASLAIPGTPLSNNCPIDAAITGIIDDIS